MMKVLTGVALLFFAISAFANQKALTDKSDVVILKDNDNGKHNITPINLAEIPTNNGTFVKSPDASFELKSSKTDASIFLDPSKWTFEKVNSGSADEYSFKYKSDIIFGKLVTEKEVFSVEKLTDIAFSNIQAFVPNTKIVKKEYRIVNGQKVIYLEMAGTTKGRAFSYFGYYYSNKFGMNQLVTWGLGKTLDESVITDIQTFLNGLIQQEKESS